MSRPTKADGLDGSHGLSDETSEAVNRYRPLIRLAVKAVLAEHYSKALEVVGNKRDKYDIVNEGVATNEFAKKKLPKEKGKAR